MIRILLFSLLFLGFSSAFADTFPAPDWRGGKCAILDGNGDVAQWISNDVCRKAVGSSLKWDKATCNEVTPANALIQEIQNKSVCRCIVGTMYMMSGDYCGEFTPNGTKLRWLKDKALCSVDSGVTKKRCN